MRRDSDAIVVPCGAHETNKLPWMDVEICVRDLCAPRLKRRVPLPLLRNAFVYPPASVP
jgi:hypothetical protein